MKHLTLIIVGLACLGSVHSHAQSPSEKSGPNCVERIIAEDSALGEIRNHACETISLSSTIDQYADALEKLDFSECPSGFTHAFSQHIDAWKNMKTVTDHHPELRGEMHELFDLIALSADSIAFKASLKDIWDTWDIIEKEMGK